MSTRRISRCFAAVFAVFLASAWLAACANSAAVTQDVEPADDAVAVTQDVEPPADAAAVAQGVEPADDATAVAQDVEPADAAAVAQGVEPADDATPVAPAASSVRVVQDLGPITSLRDVDFENGFTYMSGYGGGTEVTVTDGQSRSGEGEDDLFFGVGSIEFGDLDGDGQEEAAVSAVFNTGGSGNFTSLEAFRLVDGQVESAGKIGFGDRAHGGIFDIMIEDGMVRVWSYGSTGGACCPTQISESRVVLGSTEVVVAETLPALALVLLNDYQDEMRELKFLPGASAGAITVESTTTTAQIVVEAAAGQLLAIDAIVGADPIEVSARNVATGEVTSSQRDSTEISLPDDAVYEVSVELNPTADGPADLLLNVSITNANAYVASPVSWTPQIEQTVVSDDPVLASSVAWPQFASEHLGTDAANGHLRDFALALDDLWLDAVRADDAPTSDNGVEGAYEATYRVSVFGDGIVSVRFDYYEYLCCLPHPNHGPVGIVLDLATGEVIPARDIVDLSRRAELNEIWFASLAYDENSLVDATFIDAISDPATATFDAITVVPGGIELATGRGSLIGASPGTTTFLSFGSLGDLVQPGFAARLP